MTISMCRACGNFCRLRVEVENGRLTKVSGDPSDPVYKGFSCIRGISQPAFYNHPDRLLHSMKRQPDGSYAPIPASQALDEIAARLAEIRDRHGVRAVANYWGMMSVNNAGTIPFAEAFMRAFGSPMTFNAATIDKPGRAIAQAMHGVWQAPRPVYEDPEAILLIGLNPLTSFQAMPMGNPGRWYLEHLAAGMKLIVIDPRRSDIARRATIHLQNRPGTDAAVMGAIIRIIIEEGLYDREFIEENVDGLEAMRAAVSAFDPRRSADFAGVEVDDLIAAARIIGSARRGGAISGTGPSLSGSSTVIEYLALCLDTLCGRYQREGDLVRAPGVLLTERPAIAQANPPRPAYGFGETMRATGFRASAMGMPTGVLADEMLLKDDERPRAMISVGGNPANAWPDEAKAVAALQSLDLLVQIDPWMSSTARLAHYVIAPKLAYETPASTARRENSARFATPNFAYEESFGQYFPALLEPPPGSDLVEEWQAYLGLAQRLGLTLELPAGDGQTVAFGPGDHPTSDDLVVFFSRGSRVPLDEVKQHPDGAFFPGEPLYVKPKTPGWTGKLDIGNPDVMADLAAVGESLEAPVAATPDFPFRLLCRRVMATFNSSFHDVSTLRGRPYNPVYMHPDDLEALSLTPGQMVEIESRSGCVRAVIEVDAHLRPGTISVTHGYGKGEDDEADPRAAGFNVNRLLGGTYERYSGQPLMSNVPVAVRGLAPAA
jgi:anaerobic selenocysteine-containing dehydrogenase